jgi:hypothetical protein
MLSGVSSRITVNGDVEGEDTEIDKIVCRISSRTTCTSNRPPPTISPVPIAGFYAMPFALRYHYRFPVFGLVKYERGNGIGYGSVTNLSSLGWRISGSLPVECGDVCALRVRLPTKQWVSVMEGKVRWVCGEECGIETLVIESRSQSRLNDYIQARLKAL